MDEVEAILGRPGRTVAGELDNQRYDRPYRRVSKSLRAVGKTWDGSQGSIEVFFGQETGVVEYRAFWPLRRDRTVFSGFRRILESLGEGIQRQLGL